MFSFSNWEDWKKKEEENKQLESKNHQIDMRIARICYDIYKEGKPE